MKICAHYAAKRSGEEPYSSNGWSLTIEIEPPAEVQEDRDKLRSYVERLFLECRARVEAELAQTPSTTEEKPAPRARTQPRHRPMRGPNGRLNGNGHSEHRNGHFASPKQLNFLRSLAEQQRIGYGGLQDMAQSEFGTSDLLHLTKKQASHLIDALRPDER